MEYKQHFKLLIEVNAFVIDDDVLFANAFPVENEYKERKAAIVFE